jgi:hypothetical protein
MAIGHIRNIYGIKIRRKTGASLANARPWIQFFVPHTQKEGKYYS